MANILQIGRMPAENCTLIHTLQKQEFNSWFTNIVSSKKSWAQTFWQKFQYVTDSEDFYSCFNCKISTDSECSANRNSILLCQKQTFYDYFSSSMIVHIESDLKSTKVAFSIKKEWVTITWSIAHPLHESALLRLMWKDLPNINRIFLNKKKINNTELCYIYIR